MKKTTIFNPGIGKPNSGLPLKFGLPKNVKGGKPKFSVYLLVYRSVYPEKPINKGILTEVNQVNQEYIKELVIIDIYTKEKEKAHIRAYARAVTIIYQYVRVVRFTVSQQQRSNEKERRKHS